MVHVSIHSSFFRRATEYFSNTFDKTEYLYQYLNSGSFSLKCNCMRSKQSELFMQVHQKNILPHTNITTLVRIMFQQKAEMSCRSVSLNFPQTANLKYNAILFASIKRVTMHECEFNIKSNRVTSSVRDTIQPILEGVSYEFSVAESHLIATV